MTTQEMVVQPALLALMALFVWTMYREPRW